MDQALSRLKVSKVVPVDELSNGKFQSNMEFLQWLYGYTHKISPSVAGHNPDYDSYNGYEMRIEAYKKQKKKKNQGSNLENHHMQIAPHLIPNKAVYRS